VKVHPIVLFHKFNAALMATLKPLGIWGLGCFAFIDSGLIPLPIDALVIDYVIGNHRKLLLYCFMGAAGSALGSLIPYYIGRGGGELFLLKRINRERYEKLRDRFENQEFMVITLAAMTPPPMPIKLFEFAAGVFEMRTLPFAGAMFSGKFLRFLAWSLLVVLFGPGIAQAWRRAVHEHFNIVMALVSAAGLLFVLYILRKIFDRKRGTRLPSEDGERAYGEED
jgi:membrane protein YqaA with SNARE-associated domain